MHRARKIAALFVLCATSAFAQTITTVAGGGATYLANNVPATYAHFYEPSAIAVDSNGNYYIADCNPSSGYGTVIYKVTASTNTISIVAGTGASGYTGDNGPATSATFSNQVYGLAVAPSGNIIYISDNIYAVVRKVTVSTGVITTYAGYNPTKAAYAGGFGGDGGQAAKAYLHAPRGLYVDANNLYIADNANQRVRKVASTGIISTVAGNGTEGYTGDGGAATSAELDDPTGVSLDAAGNIYISNSGINGKNATVREVYVATGIINTIAGGSNSGMNGDGGPAIAAQLNFPQGLTVDQSTGNVYIADTLNNEVREVTSDGDIKTVAGSGKPAGSTYVTLNQPYGVAFDVSSGKLYIADQYDGVIKMLH